MKIYCCEDECVPLLNRIRWAHFAAVMLVRDFMIAVFAMYVKLRACDRACRLDCSPGASHKQ